MFTTDVIRNGLFLLLDKEVMKKANRQIDFASDKINVLGRDFQVIFITSGHYCLPIGTLNTFCINFTEEVNEEVNLCYKEFG